MNNKIEKGALYIVATPIGNMLDITERAKKVLAEVDFIAAEDTRVTGKLMMLLGIKKPFISYYEHNKESRHEAILQRLRQGESAALVTDAGTPAISDPGEKLVKHCRDNGIKVIPVPGANAAITALSASGLPSGRFVFEGFLKDKKSDRVEQIENLSRELRTIILYCAPHDIEEQLKELYVAFGNRDIVIAREITKLNETIISTTLENVQNDPPVTKGEFVLIISGYIASNDEFWCDISVDEHVEYYKKLSLDTMSACKQVAKDRGLSKSEIYKQIIDNKQ
ncbi:MAG: 16S rRNA (cytidine(1402)-2'-O)-methyltransferase [Clostridiales bacterium GWF2_38_85]|nr:MAG: 16S rRNA (cytidine(1402)-2'-O)-methyltransferase [Clostridiales bacterium GWF2_38_85]HBL83951.1 16S rRNA (cytidine(1402)-2'-O)-methyltransferase [Clostridiales bacterium]